MGLVYPILCETRWNEKSFYYKGIQSDKNMEK